jgi:hypothetical protein
LDEHELALLRQAVAVADICEDLQALVDRDGPLVASRLGEPRAHPALVELRQQRIVLTRLIVALRVPVGEPATRAGCSTGARGACTGCGVRREAPPRRGDDRPATAAAVAGSSRPTGLGDDADRCLANHLPRVAPGGVGRRLPFGECGDSVDVFPRVAADHDGKCSRVTTTITYVI